MQITYLPILRSDETLYSIAARIRFGNVARDDRDACRSLFGPSSSIRLAEYPANLVRFSLATRGNFGDAQKVLTEMTLFGFFDNVGGSPGRAAKWRRPVETAGYGLATLSNGHINTWRACSRCVDSDLEMYGGSYWRRSHQLPGAFFCLDHHIPLCFSVADDRHIRFSFPEQTTLTLACRSPGLAQYDDVLIRLSRLVKETLFCPADETTLRFSHAAIFRALENRNLLTAEGEIYTERFAVEFSHEYGFLRGHSDFRNALSSEGIRILFRSLRRTVSWRRPLHNLLLIDWLFGSWHAFREQCIWQSTMDSPNSYKAEKRVTRPSDEKWSHRDACIAFLNTSQSPRRSEFFLAARRSFQWLLRNDSKWFDLNFPDARFSALQGELF